MPLNQRIAPFARRKGREQAKRCERGMPGEEGGLSFRARSKPCRADRSRGPVMLSAVEASLVDSSASLGMTEWMRSECARSTDRPRDILPSSKSRFRRCRPASPRIPRSLRSRPFRPTKGAGLEESSSNAPCYVSPFRIMPIIVRETPHPATPL